MFEALDEIHLLLQIGLIKWMCSLFKHYTCFKCCQICINKSLRLIHNSVICKPLICKIIYIVQPKLLWFLYSKIFWAITYYETKHFPKIWINCVWVWPECITLLTSCCDLRTWVQGGMNLKFTFKFRTLVTDELSYEWRHIAEW